MSSKEVEIPVVSKKLAEIFEELKEDKPDEPASKVCKGSPYCGTKEYNKYSIHNLEKLLMRMYLVGYEIGNPERYVIRLFTSKDRTIYLYKDSRGKCTSFNDFTSASCDELFKYSDGFTKEELDDDSDLKELSKACACIPFNKD